MAQVNHRTPLRFIVSFAALCMAVLLSVIFTMPRSLATSYDKVASASDMTTVETVGVEGMEPIALTDVDPGTYDVEVESSSSMFKIEKASLQVDGEDGQLTLTLSGKAYPYLYAGTAKKAASLNDPEQYIAYTENADGKYQYTLPLKALDASFPCAAFSKNKEQWYDRNLLVRADSLPEGAVKVELPDYDALEKAAQEKRVQEMKEESGLSKDNAVPINLRNGSYSINVAMTGGSGKASISSPTTLTVIDGKAYATILWSSPNYDYMIVDGEKITPQNVEEGSNSSFLIPILAFDEPFTVIADTTAMSKPHEIEYQLTFDQSSIKHYSSKLWVYTLLALLIVVAGAFGIYKFWTSDFLVKKK